MERVWFVTVTALAKVEDAAVSIPLERVWFVTIEEMLKNKIIGTGLNPLGTGLVCNPLLKGQLKKRRISLKPLGTGLVCNAELHNATVNSIECGSQTPWNGSGL